MAYATTMTSKDAKTAFKEYLQKQSASYNAYLQSNASPQLSNATQTINALIGAVNPGALPSGTATEVANVLRTTAQILNQTNIDYTNLSKGDISTIIKGTISVFLTRDVFSDGKWVSYLSKLNSQLLGGVLDINSPLVKTVVGNLTTKAAQAITSGLSWNEAKEAANECKNLQDQIQEGTQGCNLDQVGDDLQQFDDEYDREELQDGISVEEATGGQMKHESKLPETPPEFKWGFYDESEGNLIIEIDSYVADDFTARSNVATIPLEKGSYASYNKVNEGRTGTAIVAKQAENSDIQAFHDKLEELRVSPTTFTMVSPNIVLKNMTVEGFNFKRDNRTSCNELLIANITVREIKDASIKKQSGNTVIENPANAGDTTPEKQGQVGTEEVKTQGLKPEEQVSDEELDKELGADAWAYKSDPAAAYGETIGTPKVEVPIDKTYKQLSAISKQEYQQALDAYNKQHVVKITKLEEAPAALKRYHNIMRSMLADNFAESQLALYQAYPTQVEQWTGGSLIYR